MAKATLARSLFMVPASIFKWSQEDDEMKIAVKQLADEENTVHWRKYWLFYFHFYSDLPSGNHKSLFRVDVWDAAR